jgi:hypothetical protein
MRQRNGRLFEASPNSSGPKTVIQKCYDVLIRRIHRTIGLYSTLITGNNERATHKSQKQLTADIKEQDMQVKLKLLKKVIITKPIEDNTANYARRLNKGRDYIKKRINLIYQRL